MFTGIITHAGKFAGKKGGLFSFRAEESICKKLVFGSSIAVNGVCLTVCKKPSKTSFLVTVMPETMKKTTLGDLKKDDLVNLELPASPDSFLAGHIVQGHVDCTGTIADILLDGNSRILKVTIPAKIGKYIVQKGSIALNGISLTIIKAGRTYFTIGIIPHTWTNTMLRQAKIGDKVNLETDIIAKYLEKLC